MRDHRECLGEAVSDFWGEVECRLAIGCFDPVHRDQRGYFLYGLFSLYNFIRHSAGQKDRHFPTIFIKSRIIFAAGVSVSRKRRVTFCLFKKDVASIGSVLFRSGKESGVQYDFVCAIAILVSR